MLLTSPFNIVYLLVSLPMSLLAFCILELFGLVQLPLFYPEITPEFPMGFSAPLSAPSGTVLYNGVIAWTKFSP